MLTTALVCCKKPKDEKSISYIDIVIKINGHFCFLRILLILTYGFVFQLISIMIRTSSFLQRGGDPVCGEWRQGQVDLLVCLRISS